MGGSSQPALKCSKLEFGALWNTLGWWARAAFHIPALPMPGGGEGSAAPYHCSIRDRFHLSPLAFWVFNAPVVSGSWLTRMGEAGWLRSCFWPGFSQIFADRSDTEEQVTALTKDPKLLSRQEVPLLQLFTTALQSDAGWLQPLGAQCCAPARAAPCLRAKVGRKGRETRKAVFLHIPMVLFWCLVCGWVPWWRERVLTVGCCHQKRGTGVFRHNFLNPEQQSNSDTQPPTCKVVHGWCCNFSGCL